jgi:integrase
VAKRVQKAEAELSNPRSLALPDYAALEELADALVAASADRRYHRTFPGWGEIVKFMACTAARIGEVSGVRAMDIDQDEWIWTLIRQTTPSPGGLQDKSPKSKRTRYVPIMPEIRPMVTRRIALTGGDPMARLFTGPRGGRITTAVLRNATDWDKVVRKLGYDYLRRHDLRHTGLTWMADAGVPVHVLREIAGHGALTTTQRYLHPDRQKVKDAGQSLHDFLRGPWSQTGPKEPDQSTES